MTTFNRTVKKDTINSYTITEHGYWDYKGNVSTSEDTTIDITLEQYYNVDSRYKINTHGVPYFILSSCILPNNKTYTSKKYALDKIGHDYILIEDYYYNYINRGEQVVDGKTGLMTNITNTNNIGKLFNPEINTWSITVEIQTPSSFSEKNSILGAYDTPYSMPELYLNQDGTLGLCLSSDKSSWDIADNVLSTLTLMTSNKYRIVLAYNGSSYTVKVTQLNDYFVTDEQTYIEIASATPIYTSPNQYLNIGYSAGGNCFTGDIYLNNTHIVVYNTTYEFYKGFLNSAPGVLEENLSTASEKSLNIFLKRNDNTLLLDEKMQTKDYMWVGTKTFEAYNVDAISAFDIYANYEVTGELIPTDTGLCVGPFSATDYIKASNINLDWINSFSAYLTIRTGSDITSAQSIFSNALNGSIGIHNGKWKALTENLIYGQELQQNTEYDIKIVQDTNNLYLYSRITTLNDTNPWELQLTTTPQYIPQDTFYIGNNGKNEPFSGKIFLKTVKIDAEETSWNACDENAVLKPM